MKRLTLFALVAVLSASCSAGGGGGGDAKPLVETPYYPLKIGNTWTYSVAGEQAKVVNKVVAHERKGDMMCAKIESTSDGKVIGSEHIGVTEQGIYRCALNGSEPSSPIQLFKLPPRVGDEWKLDAKVAGDKLTGKVKVDTEETNVPAGGFKQPFVARNTLEVNGRPFGTQNYFVKDIGLVKTQIDGLGGRKPAVLELEKFTLVK